MKKLTDIPLAPYGTGVAVFVGQPKEAARYFRRRFKGDVDFGDAEGYTVHESGVWTFVYVRRAKSRATVLGALAHEAYHAANFILAERGVKLHRSNDESTAYLVGHIVSEAVSRLRL